MKKRRSSLGWGVGEAKGHRVCKRGKPAKGSDAVTTITHLRGGCNEAQGIVEERGG